LLGLVAAVPVRDQPAPLFVDVVRVNTLLSLLKAVWAARMLPFESTFARGYVPPVPAVRSTADPERDGMTLARGMMLHVARPKIGSTQVTIEQYMII